MVKVGDTVKVTNLYYTRLHCGRESQYNIGDTFTVHDINEDERGIIISDDDYNFVHENDFQVINNV